MFRRTGAKTNSAIRRSSNEQYKCVICRFADIGRPYNHQSRRHHTQTSSTKAAALYKSIRRPRSLSYRNHESSTQLGSMRNVHTGKNLEPDPSRRKSATKLDGSLATRGERTDYRPRLNRDGQQWLRKLTAKGRPDEETLTEALAKLSKYDKGYKPWSSRQLPALRKLEHTFAASSSVAKFQNAETTNSGRGSGRLLREVLQIQQHADESKARTTDQHVDLKDLPVSPILHPRLTKIRRHMMAKAAPPRLEVMTAFEKRLSENPFARMLASDVRMCVVTGMRLPTSLLTSFGIKSDPASGRPWMVPNAFKPQKKEHVFLGPAMQGLKGDDISPLSLKALPDLTSEVQLHRGSLAADDFKIEQLDESERLPPVIDESLSDVQAESDPNGNTMAASARLPSVVNVTGSSGYVSSTWASLRYVSENRHNVNRFMPIRWRVELKKAANDVFVRPKMGEYVKKLMSHRLARQIAWLQEEHGSEAIVKWTGNFITKTLPNREYKLTTQRATPCNSHLDTDIAAILYFGDKLDNTQSESFEETQDCRSIGGATGDPVVREDKLDHAHKDVAVPLFNMQELMGETELQWLQAVSRKKKQACKNKAVAVLGNSITTDVLSFAWQLQQYIRPGRFEESMVVLEDLN